MNKQEHVLNAVLLAIGVGFVLEPAGGAATFVAIVEVFMPLVLGALLPDVDTAFGTHRKTLHNLPVLALFLAYPAVFTNLNFVWAGILTHYVLDLVGSRRGIAPFFPFWDAEFGVHAGVTTSSKFAEVVTVGITLVELAAFAAGYYLLPQYLLPALNLAELAPLAVVV
jgi:membrane-bound metal-dependent hydrolase YbcI (DUF457 family)